MGDSIAQNVISFTANYAASSSVPVTPDASYEALGITDMPLYMNSLEDSFGLIYEAGDEDGIIIVDDAIMFIKKKMHSKE